MYEKPINKHSIKCIHDFEEFEPPIKESPSFLPRLSSETVKLKKLTHNETPLRQGSIILFASVIVYPLYRHSLSRPTGGSFSLPLYFFNILLLTRKNIRASNLNV